MKTLLKEISGIAREAGNVIMDIYESNDFGTEVKNEEGYKSPLTRADKAANRLIIDELAKVNDLPVVSEENEQRNPGTGRFWLVDPLDGTKEFLKRNGEFTVNIALVEGGRPVLGVVYAPAINVLYAGDVEAGVAFKVDADGMQTDIIANAVTERPVIAASRSHKGESVERLLKRIGEHDEISMGSSLKICLVAEGKAMLYPRLAPTCLWDTAAAEAVVIAAGGVVKSTAGKVLEYDPRADLKNPHFVVESANNTIDWEGAL